VGVEVLGRGRDLARQANGAVGGVEQEQAGRELGREPGQRRAGRWDRLRCREDLEHVRREYAEAGEVGGRARSWERIDDQAVPGVGEDHRLVGEAERGAEGGGGDGVASSAGGDEQGGHGGDGTGAGG
jgi:hypothetical protein